MRSITNENTSIKHSQNLICTATTTVRNGAHSLIAKRTFINAIVFSSSSPTLQLWTMPLLCRRHFLFFQTRKRYGTAIVFRRFGVFAFSFSPRYAFANRAIVDDSVIYMRVEKLDGNNLLCTFRLCFVHLVFWVSSDFNWRHATDLRYVS